jgi:iron complex outermembrane recepter protein
MKTSIPAILVGLAAFAPLGAYAQSAGPGEAEKREDIVIVTATKRAQSAQDVPMQINVFSDAFLRKNSVEEFSDLSTSIPNLVVPDGIVGAANVTIRGISSPSRAGTVAEQPVSVFQDGVFAPSGSLDLLIFDTDRVEIIRGPQGAIWGRNTLAGVISFATARPTDELEGYVRGGVGNFNSADVRAAVSGPLIADKLNGRIAFGHDKRDGYTKRVGGGTAGSIDRSGLRGSLEFTPNADVTFTLIGQYDENEFNNVTPEFFTGPFAVAAGTDGFQRISDTDFHEPSKTEASGMTALVDWDIGNLLLSSVTGYRKLENSLLLDSDASPDFLINEFIDTSAKQFSQELRLSNEPASNQSIDWMVGLEYYQRDDDLNGGSLQGPALVGVGPGEGQAREAISFENQVTSLAAFGTLDFHVTDKLTLNSGLRVANEEKTNLGTLGVTLELTGQPVIPLLAATSPERTLDDDQVSPFLGISYTPSDNILLYANWGRGNKSGGFNDIRATQVAFDSETGDSFEAGVKSELLGGRAIVNANLFLINYKDMQIRSFEGRVPVFINAGEATSQGFEADMSFEATHNLRLIGGLGYLDATFDKFTSPAGADLSGYSLPNAPEWSYSIAADYARPVANWGEFYTYAEASYTGDHYLDFVNDPDGMQDGYVLLNARIGMRFGSGVGVALWGRNLTDEDYGVDFQGDLPAGLFGGSKHQVLGAPRTYGVEIAYEF